MKKRQMGIAGIIIGQAIGILVHEKKMRKDMEATPGLWNKLVIFGKKRRETNQNLANDVSAIDREKTRSSIEEDAKYDAENVKVWFEEQKQKDWEKEGKEIISKLVEKAPSKAEVEKIVQSFYEKVLEWGEGFISQKSEDEEKESKKNKSTK